MPINYELIVTNVCVRCNILCSDKTGTLTANKLSIHEPFVAEGVDPDWMMCVAVLASSHNVRLLDPSQSLYLYGNISR